MEGMAPAGMAAITTVITVAIMAAITLIW